MSMLRVFTAVTIPDSVKRIILSSIPKLPSEHGISFVDSQHLHLALNFIGNVKDTEIPELCSAFASALNDFSPFEIEMRGFNAFPDIRRPRVLWVGVEQGKEELVALNKKFRDIIEDFGFLQEKRYTPHLTIGRAQKTNPQPEIIQAIQTRVEKVVCETIQVKNVTVYNSLPEKSGPSSIPLATLKL
jgi:2'-5' RNA ligase